MSTNHDEIYWKSHHLDSFFEEMKTIVLKQRPKQPLAFLAAYLDHKQVFEADSLNRQPLTDVMEIWSPIAVSRRTRSDIDIKSPSSAVNSSAKSHSSSRNSSPVENHARNVMNFPSVSCFTPTPTSEVPDESHSPYSTFTFVPRKESQDQEVNDYRLTPPPSNESDDSELGKLKKFMESVTKSRNGREFSLGFTMPFGMDIGGTLTKTVIFEPNQELYPEAHHHYRRELSYLKHSIKYGSTGERHPNLTFSWGKEGSFHFVSFESRRVTAAIQTFKENNLLVHEKFILATGGGSQKYADVFKKELDVNLVKGDELACLLLGINFILENVEDECYFLENLSTPLESIQKPLELPADAIFPYILVNIGSGVSILLVKSERCFKRISGTTIGGGTYLGLCQLLAKVSSFEDAVKLAESGDPKNIDMLVRDIYGGDYATFNLSGDTVASSFGKAMAENTCIEDLNPADVSASLLRMIGINIAQLAYLCAMRHSTTRIMFVGSFLRNNALSLNALAYSINYWSHGVMRALFLRHEGHFGAMGAFLLQGEVSESAEDEE